MFLQGKPANSLPVVSVVCVNMPVAAELSDDVCYCGALGPWHGASEPEIRAWIWAASPPRSLRSLKKPLMNIWLRLLQYCHQQESAGKHSNPLCVAALFPFLPFTLGLK